jgi:hypothetical protein
MPIIPAIHKIGNIGIVVNLMILTIFPAAEKGRASLAPGASGLTARIGRN